VDKCQYHINAQEAVEEDRTQQTNGSQREENEETTKTGGRGRIVAESSWG